MAPVDLATARERVAARAVRPGTERVPFGDAAGRVLADDVVAAVGLPGADMSAMDGWAVRAADTPGTLGIAGESRAGTPFEGTIGAGQAVAVSTGATLPAGADAVARREVGTPGRGVVTVEGVAPGRDVRRRGEVIEAGAVLLPAGRVVTAAAVGALGAVGAPEVTVLARPRVALVATGDELVAVGEPLPPGGVYDANRVGVAAQVMAAGGLVVATERVGDDPAATVAALERAFAAADVVVTVGGVSVGPHDHVRPALATLGTDEMFAGLAVTPARPTWFGVRDGIPVLALPGNPVSAAIALRLLGPALLGRPDAWHLRGVLRQPVTPRPGHVAAILGRMRDGWVEAEPMQAAHAVASLARADVVALAGDVEGSPAGSVQEVVVLPL